jgi:hypothetical protein
MSSLVAKCLKDEFILFVPPENKNNPAEMRSTREYILDRMLRMITQTFTKTTTAAKRDACFEEELKAREVDQEVCVGHEFHVRILSYPGREQIDSGSNCLLDMFRKILSTELLFDHSTTIAE